MDFLYRQITVMEMRPNHEYRQTANKGHRTLTVDIERIKIQHLHCFVYRQHTKKRRGGWSCWDSWRVSRRSTSVLFIFAELKWSSDPIFRSCGSNIPWESNLQSYTYAISAILFQPVPISTRHLGDRLGKAVLVMEQFLTGQLMGIGRFAHTLLVR